MRSSRSPHSPPGFLYRQKSRPMHSGSLSSARVWQYGTATPRGSMLRLPPHRTPVPVRLSISATGAPSPFTQWASVKMPRSRRAWLLPVRELFGRIPEEDLAIASFAVRMIGSAAASRFCGRCGHATEPVLSERAWKCPGCGLGVYPRISPGIIVLIIRGEEILLARSPRFPAGMHSVIAGFTEPGETLEHAVCREVREEIGITIKNIRYFASEPWPFPDSLMIAFVADYATGEITIDNNEIVSAGWFSRDNLPGLPARMSIARALIDWWVKSEEIPVSKSDAAGSRRRLA